MDFGALPNESASSSQAHSPSGSVSTSPPLADIVNSIPLRPDALTVPLEPADLPDILQGFVSESTATTLILELEGKKLLYSCATIENDTERVQRVCNLLDFALILYELGHCELRLTHEYIEDLLDIQTIDWCQSFWPYILHREDRLAKNLDGQKRPGRDLIRYCNALLRRLSKTQNSSFAGQILIFLANAFPLSERSGLNHRGEFDTDNITVWEADDERSLYSRFWSLQRIFADPTTLLAKPELQPEFQDSLKTVMDELRRHTSAAGTTSQRTKSPASVMPTPAETSAVGTPIEPEDETTFAPKWLTSKSLFELQLQDPLFRRAIYAQTYFLCDFLLAHVVDTPPPTGTNKSVIYPRTITPDLAKFLKATQDTISRPPSAWAAVGLEPAFTRSLKSVVSRDANWQGWKLNNSPSFEKPSVPASEIEQAKREIDGRRGMKRAYRFKMGTPALSRLSSTPTGIELLRNKQRYAIPDPEVYCEKIREARDVLTTTTDPDLVKETKEGIASKEWRGLRAARAQSTRYDFARYFTGRSLEALFGPESETEPKKIKTENM
ncbi:THO complex, subunit THOC1 [Lipomyces tetrasporus]|uniref:THO complex, subunit THOC1 n=1 Tax=Lipomyces tetrasporus TaxID=54092 RepID=A0AAD7QP00_9ASCO|nr:THO complex, subunit THOC1 [Lipomyces tetrasporus]KAJ8098628.1 THO complex, subunit THOC1 [Lipomyces tetrasporus]